jgi:putative oxidoreductase
MTHYASTGLLILRLDVAIVMFFHGTQKLFGWWGGDGLDGAERFFASQGFRPPRLMAVVASVTETTGAFLVGSGLLTMLGVAMLTGVLTNVTALHLRNGLDHRKHGFELEFALLGSTVAVGLCTAGAWSLDHALHTPTRSWLGTAAVGLGIACGLVIVATRDRQKASAPHAHLARSR